MLFDIRMIAEQISKENKGPKGRDLTTRKKIKTIVICGLLLLAAAYLYLCITMRLTVRESSFLDEDCMLYYIVNTDGMKGLGHSILMIVDEEGCGTVCSFNGLQRSLGECLLGESGIGKFSTGVMNAEETEKFLRSGDLCLDGDQLTDNYDVALYRPITMEAYQAILEQTAPYLAAEVEYQALYEKWAMAEDAVSKAEYQQALKRMAEDESLPLYQIYTHNCDHAARMIAGTVDQELQKYTESAWRMTPNGNLKAFAGRADDWGVMTLGKQRLPEKILMFFMIF